MITNMILHFPIFISKKMFNLLNKWRFNSFGNNISIAPRVSLQGYKYIRIEDNVAIDSYSEIYAWTNYRGKSLHNSPIIEIRKGVVISRYCQLSCAKSITIGEGALLGPNVLITDNMHGDSSASCSSIAPIERDLSIGEGITIGSRVWLGRNVCVMPGVTIGDGAIVGANAVVTHNIPSNCVAVGVPARVVKNIS